MNHASETNPAKLRVIEIKSIVLIFITYHIPIKMFIKPDGKDGWFVSSFVEVVEL